MTNGNIVEVFRSFQGEGEYVGYMQVFIRLAGCNYGCPFCDTDYDEKNIFLIGDKEFSNPITPDEFVNAVLSEFNDRVHSYSFTGGEPLLQSEFLLECAQLLKEKSKAKLFLETSGLHELDASKLDGLFDIMSIDVKTFSDKVLQNVPILFNSLKNINKSEWYLKLLLDKNIKDDIIKYLVESAKSNGIKEMILQPVDSEINEDRAFEIYDMFYEAGVVLKLIPQTHKIMNFR